MKIFLLYFEMAIKITGSAQTYRGGRVRGNTPIFLWPYPTLCNMTHSLSLVVFIEELTYIFYLLLLQLLLCRLGAINRLPVRYP